MKPLIALCIAITLTLTACDTAETAAPTPTAVPPTEVPTFTRVTEPTLISGSTIPAPTGEVILRITGAIGVSNVEGETAVELDMATLESFGLIEYGFADYVATGAENGLFRGVMMSDLLAALQLAESTTLLNIRALDDYSINIDISEVQSFPVMLALQQDNTYLTVETFGPTRIIYPYHISEVWENRVEGKLIYSIASINVE